jgi:hypothetical protein
MQRKYFRLLRATSHRVVAGDDQLALLKTFELSIGAMIQVVLLLGFLFAKRPCDVWELRLAAPPVRHREVNRQDLPPRQHINNPQINLPLRILRH